MARQHTAERLRAAGEICAVCYDGAVPEPLRAAIAAGALAMDLPEQVAEAIRPLSLAPEAAPEGPPPGASDLAVWAWWHATLTGREGQTLGPRRVRALARAVRRLMGACPPAGEALNTGLIELSGPAHE